MKERYINTTSLSLPIQASHHLEHFNTPFDNCVNVFPDPHHSVLFPQSKKRAYGQMYCSYALSSHQGLLFGQIRALQQFIQR